MTPIQFYNYNTAMLDILLKSFGDGFIDVICTMSARESDNPNNVKQMRRRMKNGSRSDYKELWQLLNLGIEQFTDGRVVDEEGTYCNLQASDKYNEIRFRLLNRFFYFNAENFFYESSESVFAYLTAGWLLTCNNAEPDPMPEDDEFLKKYHPEEYEKWNTWQKEAFKPQYYTVFHDVLIKSEGNKTFYKWVIDDFYAMMAEKNADADTLMKCVFGENPDTGEIRTSFVKLKYEAGKRDWKTIDALLRNEHNNPDLEHFFSKHPACLAPYQIFQSRMFAAYIFENLRAVLPDYIGAWNERFWSILIDLFKRNAKEEALKPIFFSADYEKKTAAYRQAVQALLYEEQYEKARSMLDELDASCPATKFFRSFVQLKNDVFWRHITEQEAAQAESDCKKYARYAGEFTDFARATLTDMLRMPR